MNGKHEEVFTDRAFFSEICDIFSIRYKYLVVLAVVHAGILKTRLHTYADDGNGEFYSYTCFPAIAVVGL